MAWNRSSEKKKVEVEKRGGQRNVLLKGLLAGAIVVVGAVIAAWFFWSDDKSPLSTSTSTSTSLIREVKPAAAPKAKEPPRELTEDEKRLKELHEIEAKFGKNIPKALQTRVYYLKNPPKRTFECKGPNDFLQHPCEQEIASLLMAVPGTFFLRQPTFSETFDNDFVSALMDKIDIYPTDDERTRRVKEEVTLLKKDIAKMVRETGRKPSDLMNEYAKQMFELGQYQRDLQSELREIEENDAVSNEEVEDFYNAANTLLEQKGLGKFAIPDLARRGIRLNRELQRQIKGGEK